jgi:hypothetical protein
MRDDLFLSWNAVFAVRHFKIGHFLLASFALQIYSNHIQSTCSLLAGAYSVLLHSSISCALLSACAHAEQ